MKKKMKKSAIKRAAKKAFKKVEEEVADPKYSSIVAGFSVRGLTMGADLQWKFSMSVRMRMSKAYSDYIVRMFLDHDPHELRLKELQSDIDDLARDQGLFDKTDYQANKDELDQSNEKMDKIKDEFEDLKKRCKELEFSAAVVEIKYPGDTLIVLKVPADIVSDINNVRNLLGYYKVEFTPNIDSGIKEE